MLRACSWFGLVVNIERMTQSSSATVARFGSSSLISMPALPVLRERELRRHQPRRRPLGPQIGGRRPLTGVFHERRLRIPQIDLRRPAGHEQQDHVLRFGREVRANDVRARRERVVGKQIGEAEHADAAAHALERLAPREFFYGQKITSLVESSACA